MRINFVLPHANLSGGIRVLAIYADRLRKRGHQVYIVSLPKWRHSFLSKCKSLLRHGRWPVAQEFEPTHLDNLNVEHIVIDKVRPVVDSDLPDADIVLATFWQTAPSVFALSPSKGAKAIFLQGYETSPGNENSAIDEVWRLPMRKIVISKWMIDFASQRFNDNNVLHVPNSVDLQMFNAPERGMQTRPTIGVLYSPIHLKGFDIALNVIEGVHRIFPNLRVIVFGASRVTAPFDLPEYAEYYFQPAQSQICQLYAACDVWFCCSRREGFHLPPLEAMACRCPVVSTRVGGPLDTIDDGVNGFLVDIEDCESIVNRIIEVLSFNEDKWKSFSACAYATACRYSWDDATVKLEEALRQIIKENSPN